MPQVPGIDTSTPQFSQGVPGAQLPHRGEFTHEGMALERVGQEVGNAAEVGAHIYDGIQMQHDISTATLAATDMAVAHHQLVENIKTSSPDGFVHDPDTNEIVKDKAGNPQTIAQQYWTEADSDYQNRQNALSPRAAAMFRQQVQHEVIGRNTVILQTDQLEMQKKSAEFAAGTIKNTWSKTFNDSFVPKQSPYYTSQQEDGSTREYPSGQRLFDALQQVQVFRSQQGPAEGRPGMYNPTEVKAHQAKDSAELANNWLTSAKLDLIESNGSRAALHNSLKDGSSTASMQIHSLLDIVEGKDPESRRRTDQSLPTVNSSLTPKEIEDWRGKLLAMIPAAKNVDKSEYELQKQQLGDFAKGVRNLDQFTNSPLFQKTLMAGSGLGMPTAERVKDLAPSFSAAALSSAIAATGGINSPEAKRQAGAAVLKDIEKRWPQLATMMGEKDTTGFGEAMSAEVSRQLSAKLQEDAHQMHEDPVKYMAGIQEGPQGPGGAPQYRSQMAHAIENRLNPAVDASMFSIFHPMGNGKSVIENAQLTANNGYARMFGSKDDVAILQKEQFQDQAKRLIRSKDPQMISSYFRQLDQQNLTSAQKETYIQNLVKVGELPQTYVDALNLKTPSEREARWATISAGPPPMPEGLDQKAVEETSRQENKNLFSFLDRKYGPNSPEARTARNTYDKSWQDDYKQAIGRGMNESDAKGFANDQRDKTTGSVGIVGAQHDFFGTGFLHWGSVGPQVPVEFGSNKYTPDQQKNIRDVLLHAQSKEALSLHKFVTPPGALPKNDNAPSDAETVANNASMWRRVGGGWRLQQQQLDKENRSTGISQDVQVYGSDGKPHYYEIKEEDALAGPPKGAAPSVAPAPKPQKHENMGPKF